MTNNSATMQRFGRKHDKYLLSEAPTSSQTQPQSKSSNEGAELPGPVSAADSNAPAGAAQESDMTRLYKSWQRCGPTDRRLFLADICAGSPNLWKAVDRDAGGRWR